MSYHFCLLWFSGVSFRWKKKLIVIAQEEDFHSDYNRWLGFLLFMTLLSWVSPKVWQKIPERIAKAMATWSIYSHAVPTLKRSATLVTVRLITYLIDIVDSERVCHQILLRLVQDSSKGGALFQRRPATNLNTRCLLGYSLTIMLAFFDLKVVANITVVWECLRHCIFHLQGVCMSVLFCKDGVFQTSTLDLPL